MKLLPSLLVLLSLTIAAAPAMADGSEAQRHFEGAAKAYQEGRYQDAVDLFLKAYQVDPQPELLYNVAQAYERLGDVRNALRSYRDYLRQRPAEQDRVFVETRVQNLEKRLREQGVQQVSVFSTPPGATVLLDDKPMGKTPWTGEAGSGRHVIVVRAPGYVESRREFVLTDRAVDMDIALTSSERPGASVAASQPVTPAPADSGGGARVRPWTFVAFGVGALALGGSLTFEFLRKSAETDAENQVTQLAHRDSYETMQGRQTAARVLLGVGAAAAIAGGVLLYFDLNSGSPSDTKPRVGFGCGGAACGVIGRASF
jgi:tetratricopeptide (TPR) repeat protein